MAGGPSSTALVIAAARAGALGFLAAGYKSPGAMAAEIAAVRAATAGPQIAAGGIMDARQVRAVLAAGAVAAQCYRAAAELPAPEIIERLSA